MEFSPTHRTLVVPSATSVLSAPVRPPLSRPSAEHSLFPSAASVLSAPVRLPPLLAHPPSTRYSPPPPRTSTACSEDTEGMKPRITRINTDGRKGTDRLFNRRKGGGGRLS